VSSRESIGVQPGEIIDGKYRVESVLGEGGMAVVVAAQHLQLGQRVAIKLLRPSALSNAEAVARFEREARNAVRIHSEHVARVLDVGNLSTTGAPYMVIEFLDGLDLGRLAKRGQLTIQESIGYILQACDAIGEAHALGIVHRDLKPANLFLAHQRANRSIVKVLDFGISKTSTMGSDPGAPLTGATAVMGSPLYMSPEQLRSTRDVDARSDIWALGATLYQLLAGVPPFRGETVAMLSVNILTVAAPPIRARRSEVPPELEAVVLRCLEKDPARRPSSIAELVRALQPFARGVGASLPPPGRLQQRPRRSHAPAVIIAALVLFLAAVALAVFIFWRGR
jgi:serine/threonine protein kinase